MSETSSEGSEPGRLNNADNPLLPLSLPSAAEFGSLLREFDRFTDRFRQLGRGSRTSRPATSTRQPGLSVSVLRQPAALSLDQEAFIVDSLLDLPSGSAATSLPAVAQFASGPVPNAVNHMEQEPNKPAVTFVSALPSTTYKEENDSSSRANTVAYVRVQRALLKHARKHALDSLSPHQARVWTQAIDSTGNKTPRAAVALRLCYYMRSQGYDVYSRVEASCVQLYIVNQGSYIRDKEHDVLYWKQNILTNHVDYYFPSPGNRSSRRNAVSDLAFQVADFGLPSRPAVPHVSAPTGGNFPEDTAANVALQEAYARVQMELVRDPPDAE